MRCAQTAIDLLDACARPKSGPPVSDHGVPPEPPGIETQLHRLELTFRPLPVYITEDRARLAARITAAMAEPPGHRDADLPADLEGVQARIVDGITAAVGGLLEVAKLMLNGANQSCNNEPWISIPEGAKHAGVGVSTMREWVARGELPAGRHRGTVRVRASDIDALLLRDAAEADPDRPHPRALEIVSAAKGGESDG